MAELVETAPGKPVSGDVLDEKVMSLSEHLSELRRRIVISIVFVALGTAVGWFLVPKAIDLLLAPVRPYYTGPLYFINPGGAFFIFIKIALVIGVTLASPVVLYQIWAFVGPGLTSRERRAVRPWLPLALIFAALGIGVAYAILPYVMAFLLSLQLGGILQPLLSAEQYFGFVTTLFLAFGIVMQFPFVLLLLSRAGVITAERLRRNRRIVLFGLAVFAVVVTPGGDPVSPTIMAGVMYPLYELSIFLIARGERSRAAGR